MQDIIQNTYNKEHPIIIIDAQDYSKLSDTESKNNDDDSNTLCSLTRFDEVIFRQYCLVFMIN